MRIDHRITNEGTRRVHARGLNLRIVADLIDESYECVRKAICRPDLYPGIAIKLRKRRFLQKIKLNKNGDSSNK